MNKFIKPFWQLFMSPKVLHFMSSQCVTLGSILLSIVFFKRDPSVCYSCESKARGIKWFKKRRIITLLLSLFSLSAFANRSLSKPVYDEQYLGEVQTSNVEYSNVFEQHRQTSTTKLPSEIEFRKRSNDFVSTKSSKINMRTGPGFHYPVKWVYTCKNLPLKIIEEFENWKKVCDINEDCGWIKSNLLSTKRYAMIKEDTFGYKKQNIDGNVTMRIDKFVIIRIEKCSEKSCLLSASNCKAWVQKEYIYGRLA